MSQQTLDPTSGPAPVGRRERKKHATWRALHHAALERCAEKGFDATTVEEICDQADVSVRTFFNYFRCKEDAVLGGTLGFEDMVDRLLARPADEAPFEALANTYLEKIHALGEHAEPIRVRYRLIEAHPQLKARELARVAGFEIDLAAVIAQRMGVEDPADPYARLVAAVGMSVLRSSFQSWQRGEGSRDELVALVERGFGAVLDGMPAPS